MTLINKQLKDLVAGYDKIIQDEPKLFFKWRSRLWQAYARRQDVYRAARAKHRQRAGKLPLQLGLGLLVVLLIFFGLMYVSPSLAWLEVMGGLLLVAGYGFQQGILSSPKPPRHPLHSPLKRQLFPPLLPNWYSQLNGRLPKMTKDGDLGEHAFVKQLQRTLNSSYFILHEVQPRLGDDIDVMVVGPTGIWVFEVKYWSGEIGWNPRDGWTRTKMYYAPGGVPVEEDKQVNQPPDQQCQRMAGETLNTLRRHGGQLVFTTPSLVNIKGGVVFTHPEAKYKIARPCPFQWGDMTYWQRQLKSAPVCKDLNQRKILQIVETLLARHQDLNKNGLTTISMSALAKSVIQDRESRLSTWIKEGGLK